MEAPMCEEDAPDIFQFSNDTPYVPVVERYFTTHYKLDPKKETSEDMCVLAHSNKLCLITLAPSHPLITKGKTVKKVNFEVRPGTNLLDNQPRGKFKRGSKKINKSKLCTVMCDDDTEFVLYSCIRGRLLEVNENLVPNPTWLTERPQTDGHIAIIQPWHRYFNEELEPLLTKEQYEEGLEKRANEPDEVEMKEEPEENGS